MVLKSTELRIGNIIYDSKGELKTVTAFDLINLECLENNLHHDPRCKDWRGIPLDEEWMLRLGYFKTDFGFRHSEVGSLYFNFTQDGGILCLSIRHHSEYVISRPIKYIHQLMNLYFSITGNELEIKL